MIPLLASLAFATTPNAEDGVLSTDSPMKLRLGAELGFLTALSHVLQEGKDGTTFDYAGEGGQRTLVPFFRIAADLDVGRSTFVLTYQPLDLRSEVTFERDHRIDTVDFPAGTPVNLRYGFDYFRGTWLYDLQADPEREVALGIALQLRNAVIDFTSVDGTLRSSNRDVGPVPILAFRTRQPVGKSGIFGAELTGFWAPIRYINGTGSDVEGAIADAQIRYGTSIRPGVDGFLGVRYVGGGAVGTANVSTPPGDGYSRNWLHLLSIQMSAVIR
jgi:hypothetical protein